MTKTLLTLTLVAAAALAGCDQSDHTINGNAPDDAQANTAAAPVVMPPAIVASHAYRCKDNGLLFIDWMSDGGARAKTSRDARATAVTVGDAAAQLTGNPQAKNITYNGQSCTR